MSITNPRSAFLLVAIILFVIAAIPRPNPYQPNILAAGLACLAAAMWS